MLKAKAEAALLAITLSLEAFSGSASLRAASNGPLSPVDELSDIVKQKIRREPITDENIDSKVRAADDAWEKISWKGKAATVQDFRAAVDNAKYYKDKWIAIEQTGEPNHIEAVGKKGWYQFWKYFSSRDGYTKLTGHVSDPEILTYARMRTWGLRAFKLKDSLMFDANAGNPEFLEGYRELVELGLVDSKRNLRVGLAMLTEAAGAHKGGVAQDGTASRAELYSVEWQLEKAYGDFQIGDETKTMRALEGLDDAVGTIEGTMTFGRSNSEILKLLTRLEVDGKFILKDERKFPVSDKEALTFREALSRAIDERANKHASGYFEDDVALSSDPAEEVKPAAANNTPNEIELVEGKANKFNLGVYLMMRLQVAVKEASGEDVIAEREALLSVGKKLFHPLLKKMIGESQYGNLIDVYVNSRQLSGAERKALKQNITKTGSSILASPEVVRELSMIERDDEAGRLQQKLDSPEYLVDLGELYYNKQVPMNAASADGALRLALSSFENRSRAAACYAEAIKGVLPDNVPHLWRLNAGDYLANSINARFTLERELRNAGRLTDQGLNLQGLDSDTSKAIEKAMKVDIDNSIEAVFKTYNYFLSPQRPLTFVEKGDQVGEARFTCRAIALAHAKIFFDQLGRIYSAQGDQKHSKQYNEIARSFFDAFSGMATSGREFYLRAVVREQVKLPGAEADWVKARDYFRKKAENAPDDESIKSQLAAINQKLGQNPVVANGSN